MPPRFALPGPGTRLWVPAVTRPLPPTALWGAGGFTVLARLRPGATPAAATAEVAALGPAMHELVPWDMPAEYWRETAVVPLREELVGGVRPLLLVLLGAVGLVLLIACANVGNLLLSRGAARRKEMAVRAALGAERGRIVRQLLTESALLGLVGGAVGVLLARAAVPLLAAALPPDLPRLHEVRVDARVLAFALAASLATGLVFGLVPALRAARPDLRGSMAGGRGTAGSPERQRLSALLVVGEIALSLVLVVSAGLLVQSLWRLLHVDPGFRPGRVVAAAVAPPEHRYPDDESRRRYYDALLQRVRAAPGAPVAAVGTGVPFGGDVYGSVFKIEGRPDPARAGGDWPLADARLTVSAGYFRALGIPLLAGRALSEADRADAPPVAVVSRALAERYWPGEDPLGRRLRLLTDDGWRTVVGVVGDVKWDDLAAGGGAALYLPLGQGPTGPMRVVARTRDDPAALAASLRAVVRSLDPATPVGDVRTATQLVSASAAAHRSAMLLLSLFAALALALGAVGVYGVTAHAVGQRSREFAIRLALGARPGALLRLVLAGGARVAAAGIALGLVGALALTRLLAGLLYGVTALDPLTFAAVPLLLAAVVLLASYLPARHALRVAPVRALRAE